MLHEYTFLYRSPLRHAKHSTNTALTPLSHSTTVIACLRRQSTSPNLVTAFRSREAQEALQGPRAERTMEEADISTRQSFDLRRELLTTWRNALQGRRTTPVPAQNQSPTAVILQTTENRLLAIRWHLGTFPIRPWYPNLRILFRNYTQPLRLLTKAVLSPEGIQNILDCINQIRDMTNLHFHAILQKISGCIDIMYTHTG